MHPWRAVDVGAGDTSGYALTCCRSAVGRSAAGRSPGRPAGRLAVRRIAAGRSPGRPAGRLAVRRIAAGPVRARPAGPSVDHPLVAVGRSRRSPLGVSPRGPRTTRTPSRRTGRSFAEPFEHRAGRRGHVVGSVVGAGSLLILVRVQNVAVRTFTATWVTRRPSATTDSVTSRASRSTCSAISAGRRRRW